MNQRNMKAIPSIAEMSNLQIANALLVMNSLIPFLLNPTRGREWQEGMPAQPELDREVNDSAVTTFTKVCGVLDAMLEDKRRWDIEQVDALAKSLQELYETQTRLLTEQTNVTMHMERPSTLLRPMLAQLSPTQWRVSYAELSATGSTPAEAMFNFDAAYMGLVPSAPPVPAPEAKKKRRKKY